MPLRGIRTTTAARVCEILVFELQLCERIHPADLLRTAPVPSSYNANALTSTTATQEAAQGAWCKYLPNDMYQASSTNTRTDLVHCSAFLQNNLPAFARENPQIEIRVSPRPQKHPLIKGLYINGREKPVCVRNLDPLEILKKANLLKEASGEKLKHTKKPVTSLNESVRGIWSPHHGDLRGV